MKVVALNGSPRKGGNTDILIDEFFRGATELGAACEKICLDDFNIQPPAELGDIQKDRVDLRADDDHRMILNRVLDADVVVIATPVYWQGVSSQMKCFVDRFSCHYAQDWFNEAMSGKRWAVLTPYGASEPEEAEFVLKPVKVWVRHFRGEYIGEVAVTAFRKGAVADKPEAMQAAYELGKAAVARMQAGG